MAEDQKTDDKTTEDTDFMMLSTAEVGHYIHDSRKDVWIPGKVTPHLLVRVRVKVDDSSYS